MSLLPKEPPPEPRQPDPDITTFGGYLKSLRRKRGMTQRELAAASGLDFTYISKIENNRSEHTPSETTCVMLAAALEVGSWEIMHEAGKIPTPLAEALLKLPVEIWREIAREVAKL